MGSKTKNDCQLEMYDYQNAINQNNKYTMMTAYNKIKKKSNWNVLIRYFVWLMNEQKLSASMKWKLHHLPENIFTICL